MNSKEFLEESHKIVTSYEHKQAALLPILRLCQERDGYVTPEAEQWAAGYLEVPVVHVHEVVSFYSLFHRHPIGRHLIDVCRNMSCTLLGADHLRNHFERTLGVPEGQTTPDRRFTWRTVECLCACEMAPMLQVDGKAYHGLMTPEKVDELLESLP